MTNDDGDDESSASLIADKFLAIFLRKEKAPHYKHKALLRKASIARSLGKVKN